MVRNSAVQVYPLHQTPAVLIALSVVSLRCCEMAAIVHTCRLQRYIIV